MKWKRELEAIEIVEGIACARARILGVEKYLGQRVFCKGAVIARW
jgi:hypothetical protein